MNSNFLRREALCKFLVEEILFGDLTLEQERAAHRAYHKLQIKNCEEIKYLLSKKKRRRQYEVFESKSA